VVADVASNGPSDVGLARKAVNSEDRVPASDVMPPQYPEIRALV